jgi:light-regulated signal transduction histidine kinase (bacteriophytochrome)
MPLSGGLSACDREPIHLPGSIQPFGALIVVDAGQTVVQVSANAQAWLGLAPESALGRHLADVLGEDFAKTIALALASGSHGRENILPGPPGLGLAVSVHSFADLDYIEFEAMATERPEDVSLAQRMVTELRGARSSDDLAAVAARHVRALTELDRVMVYRFGEDAHGEVVAEALAEGQDPFLGLHYPAADIPVQARRMYLSQRIRYIANVAYEPVPMLGWTGFESPVDMTYCSLRSVSPIHLEYLRNMGVGATLAMSLVIDDRLWGMIVCHHRSAIVVSPSKRALCDLTASLTAALLGARLRAEAMAARLARQQMIAAFSDRLQSFDRVAAALVDNPDDLLALTDADGAYVRIGGDVRRPRTCSFRNMPSRRRRRSWSERRPDRCQAQGEAIPANPIRARSFRYGAALSRHGSTNICRRSIPCWSQGRTRPSSSRCWRSRTTATCAGSR